MQNHTIVILDFGGQYCHLIARRIRDIGVRAEVVPSDISADELRKNDALRGVILSGGARSVHDKNAPAFDPDILELPVPLLGICYGHQLLAHSSGGAVKSGTSGEYGLMKLRVSRPGKLLAGLGRNVWMNHRDMVTSLPKGYAVIAGTAHARIAAFADERHRRYGVQFHPEVSHTEQGDRLLKNFAIDICACKPSWTSSAVARDLIVQARQAIGTGRAIIGLSGGVDSSVAAALMAKAIGKNLTAVYVDTGLMREGETVFIEKTFSKKSLDLHVVRAGRRYFRALKGVRAPERKRKIIGKLFIDIFSEIARKKNADYLVQGTIYSDRIESGITKHSSTIKSHHNVGGLPKDLKLKLHEPLRDLYKDEVRALASQIGLPKAITTRQVFPGPGLGVRVLGEVTPERAEVVRHAGRIIEEELMGTKYWKDIWMSFAVLLPVKSVGVQGDERSYKYPIVLRIVESRDAMTANFSRLPYEILETISTRITNEVKHVNRVVYDITNKPPGTMEWE